MPWPRSNGILLDSPKARDATVVRRPFGRGRVHRSFRARHDRTGNLPLFPGIFPDQMAPIVRNGADGERELVMARWGMPGPPQFGGAPITNIRNVGSPHWRGWLGKQNRCVVPATLKSY
jgi:putative SOS response-associated peptidase YedK